MSIDTEYKKTEAEIKKLELEKEILKKKELAEEKENKKNIMFAVGEVQNAISKTSIYKDNFVDVTRTGQGYYYVGYDSLIEKIRPILQKYGVVIKSHFAMEQRIIRGKFTILFKNKNLVDEAVCDLPISNNRGGDDKGALSSQTECKTAFYKNYFDIDFLNKKNESAPSIQKQAEQNNSATQNSNKQNVPFSSGKDDFSKYIIADFFKTLTVLKGEDVKVFNSLKEGFPGNKNELKLKKNLINSIRSLKQNLESKGLQDDKRFVGFFGFINRFKTSPYYFMKEQVGVEEVKKQNADTINILNSI